ncbi:MAG: fimbrial protein [Tannerellaceae bacterium]|nr:fimbrial protein [Tannerellaceae bacterium]
MKAKYTYTSLLAIATLLAVSCVNDEIERPTPTPQDPQVTFSLQMPRAAAAAPGTGLTQEEERLISNLTLLVFTPTPSGDPLRERVIENLVPTPVPNTENAQYTLTATLPTGYYRLMFLANVAGKITADPPLGKNPVHH